MIGKIALGLGLAGILLGGGVLLVSLLLPSLTNGRTSWEEAMLGIIPGALVLFLSFLLAAVGVVVMVVNKKNKKEGVAKNGLSK